jgi:hypothetical protein
MQQQNANFQKTWAKIIAKAWRDPNFKKKFLDNPNEVFKAEGIKIPSGKQIIVKECTKDTLYLTLPQKPPGELAEEQLKEIAAGADLVGIPSYLKVNPQDF